MTTSTGRRQVPDTPALIDLKVLLIACLVASPAAWRASQGLLTVDQALTRFLLVVAACVVMASVVRAVWPVLAGPVTQPAERGGTGELGAPEPAPGLAFDDGQSDLADDLFGTDPPPAAGY